MSDMVFAIVEGEYSDWQLSGYFENEEEAYKYCAIHNNEYYVEPIPKITCDFGDEAFYYQWSCVFDDDEYNDIRNIRLINTVRKPVKPRIKRWTDHLVGDLCEIVFTTLQMDAEKAKKIACDHYARLKYQKKVNA